MSECDRLAGDFVGIICLKVCGLINDVTPGAPSIICRGLSHLFQADLSGSHRRSRRLEKHCGDTSKWHPISSASSLLIPSWQKSPRHLRSTVFIITSQRETLLSSNTHTHTKFPLQQSGVLIPESEMQSLNPREGKTHRTYPGLSDQKQLTGIWCLNGLDDGRFMFSQQRKNDKALK